MNPLRLLIVTPRFWPQVGDTEIFAGHLAEEILALGARPVVLSSQWSPAWPVSMVVREVTVTRLPHAPRGGLSRLRYMIDLARWLRRSGNLFDAVYVLSLRHEAFASLLAVRHLPIPVILRCQEAGPHGDCRWHSSTRFGERLRARCRTADRIIAADADVAAELSRCGFDARKTELIPGGGKILQRTVDHRFRARSYLAEVNHDLATAEYAPVIVSVGRFSDPAPWVKLLKVWRDVAARWPTARLWFIGDGPSRSELYSQIIEWELQYQVFMPGTFEDLSDVLLAADLYVAPEPFSGSQMIIEAMSAGLPVLAAESPNVGTIIDHGRTGLIAPIDDHAAWVAAFSFICDNPSAAAKMGRAAQDTVNKSFSSAEMAKRHLNLFERLIKEKRRQ